MDPSCNNVREASKACLHGCSPLTTLPDSPARDPAAGPSSTAAFRRDFAASTVSSLLANSRFTNHESIPSLQDSFSCFTGTYPLYERTNRSDEIRAEEYCHLGSSNHVCLDYVGHGLFSYSQKVSGDFAPPSTSCSHHPDVSSLSPGFFKISPKSVELSSWISRGAEESEFESKIRKRIMAFMNISESDYTMVFTANQAAAFKILAESYAYQSNRNLLTVYDHKNEAVESMVECSKKRGAHVRSAEFLFPSMRTRSEKLKKILLGNSRNRSRNKGLFVFPLQSRMTGAQYSYLWMGLAQENKWHVLLDACALGPKGMDTLGLSLFKPDFLICSFYKVFGDSPSGFGCLFIKRSSAELALQGLNPTKTIGIVSLRPAIDTLHCKPESSSGDLIGRELSSELARLRSDLHPSKVETLKSEETSMSKVEEVERHIELGNARKNTTEIEEMEAPVQPSERRMSKTEFIRSSDLELKGLDHADELGIVLIKCRTRYLTNWLVNALMSLKHPDSDNKLTLVRIYGPKVRFERGPDIAFNVFDWKGEKIDPTLVQRLGDRHGISLSYGVLDNIRFSSHKHEEHERLIETGTSKHVRRKELRKTIKRGFEKGISVVSASIGFLTNFEDVYRVWAFISQFLDADFVEKERWRYVALNLETVEI